MSNNQPKQPTHRAYAVTKRGDKSYWREIDAAWTHQKGDGFTLKFDTCPSTALKSSSASPSRKRTAKKEALDERLQHHPGPCAGLPG